MSGLNRSLSAFLVPAGATVLCFVCAVWAVRSRTLRGRKRRRSRSCGCSCCCGMGSLAPDRSNGDATAGSGMGSRGGPAAEKQVGGSMMEQLVPEITTHALSYLDYPSLCRLSMTNSSMRRAANDDNAWKALYHKDFTLEQDSISPPNGWKAYYAATKAVVGVNTEFYNIIRERSLPAMSRLWLNADYVKCIHGSGQCFMGYAATIDSWAVAFNWAPGQAIDFEVREVCARVSCDMAWVTMKAYVDMDSGPFHVTNVFELHRGQWYMVHHHSSVMLEDGVGQHNLFG